MLITGEILDEGLGAISRTLKKCVSHPSALNFCFFKKFDQPRDLFRITSLITAPIILAAFSVIHLLRAGSNFLWMLAYSLTFNFSSASGAMYLINRNIIDVGLCLLLAAVSPVVNLIDGIGGVIVSIKEAMAPSIPSVQPSILS